MTETELQTLRERFIAQNGAWSPSWERILQADPGFFAAYLELSGVPLRSGHLEQKVKQLVHVAISAAATHLHPTSLREHTRLAIQAGASREELLETLQLAATLGIHACNVGVPLLLESLQTAGQRGTPAARTPRQEQLKSNFEASRGYWHPFFDGVLELDPDFFAAYLGFSAYPWHHGTLSPKVKELIYIGFDAAATHMFLPGLKLHIDNALGYGATASEVMEVLELASGLGMRALELGVPIIDEEWESAHAA